ncbi:MAG: hypothetical protein JST30_05650 [Armatimonadetes bacterium]|nr:hypothetical protein [Armatimonadota bacterium]
MADYIPNPDGSFEGWFNGFKVNFASLAVSLGFNPADISTMNGAYTNWNTAYTANIAAQNAAKGAAQTKANQRKTAEAVIRGYVTRIQANPACTDTMRAQLGITIRDTHRSPAPVPTDSPLLELDWSKRGQVTLHIGNNPGNESLNKFPYPAKTVLIQFRHANATEWQFLAVASTSPFVHIVGNSNAETLEYRTAYMNSKGQQGPWSEVDSAYVGAAA